MCVTSGGGVKLSAYVGIHIVICGFRAFACAFCSAFKFTAFIKFLNFELPSLGRRLFAENLAAPSVYLCCPPAGGELADEISRFFIFAAP